MFSCVNIHFYTIDSRTTDKSVCTTWAHPDEKCTHLAQTCPEKMPIFVGLFYLQYAYRMALCLMCCVRVGRIDIFVMYSGHINFSKCCFKWGLFKWALDKGTLINDSTILNIFLPLPILLCGWKSLILPSMNVNWPPGWTWV